MSDLSRLVKPALLGTRREPLPALSGTSPLAQLLAQLPDDDREYALLSAAGAISLYEQIGRQPERVGSGAFSNHLAADLPACSPAAGRVLYTLLNGRYRELLPEFLTQLAQAGQRVPEEHLPNVLAYGARASADRSLVLPVLGQAGRWLAAQNPAWAYAAPAIDTWDGIARQWQAVDTPARQTLLAQLRLTEPQRGLQLLERTWKAEPPTARVQLIRVLETGLSLTDAPFLEIALDDRDQAVRRKAAGILACLSESRLCRRMSAATLGLLRWSGKPADDLKVFYPTEIGPALIRDGVMPRQGRNIQHIRSMQLAEMIGAVPLVDWTAHWSTTPQRIVQAAQGSVWPRTLIRGFTLAAERQRQVEWAQTLLQAEQYSVTTIRLIPLLPADRFEQTLARIGPSTEPLDQNSLFIKILRKWSQPWTPSLVRFWLDHLTHHLRQPPPGAPDAALIGLFKQFARLCPLTEADEVVERLLAASPLARRSPYAEMISILRLRQLMLAAIHDK